MEMFLDEKIQCLRFASKYSRRQGVGGEEVWMKQHLQ